MFRHPLSHKMSTKGSECTEIYTCALVSAESRTSHRLQRDWEIAEYDQKKPLLKSQNTNEHQKIENWADCKKSLIKDYMLYVYISFKFYHRQINPCKENCSSGCFSKGGDNKGTFYMVRCLFLEQFGLCIWGFPLSGCQAFSWIYLCPKK